MLFIVYNYALIHLHKHLHAFKMKNLTLVDLYRKSIDSVPQDNQYLITFDKKLRQLLASAVNDVLFRKGQDQFTDASFQDATATTRIATVRLSSAEEITTDHARLSQNQPHIYSSFMPPTAEDLVQSQDVQFDVKFAQSSNTQLLPFSSKRSRRSASSNEKYSADDVKYAREPIVDEGSLHVSVFMDKDGTIIY